MSGFNFVTVDAPWGKYCFPLLFVAPGWFQRTHATCQDLLLNDIYKLDPVCFWGRFGVSICLIKKNMIEWELINPNWESLCWFYQLFTTKWCITDVLLAKAFIDVEDGSVVRETRVFQFFPPLEETFNTLFYV